MLPNKLKKNLAPITGPYAVKINQLTQKSNINAKYQGRLLTQNVILGRIVTVYDAKYNNVFDTNYYNFLTPIKMWQTLEHEM